MNVFPLHLGKRAQPDSPSHGGCSCPVHHPLKARAHELQYSLVRSDRSRSSTQPIRIQAAQMLCPTRPLDPRIGLLLLVRYPDQLFSCSLNLRRLYLMNPHNPCHHIFRSLNRLWLAQKLAGSSNLKPPLAHTGPEKPLTTHPCCPWQSSCLLAPALHIATLLPWILPSMIFPTMLLHPPYCPGYESAFDASKYIILRWGFVRVWFVGGWWFLVVLLFGLVLVDYWDRVYGLDNCVSLVGCVGSMLLLQMG